MVKKCTKCGEVKPLTEFFKQSLNRDGLAYACKKCKTKMGAEWANINRAHVNALSKAKRIRNIEKSREYSRNFMRRNLQKYAARRKIYRETNTEKIRTANRIYLKANREKYRAHWAKRHAMKLQAMPKWANSFFIGEAYSLSEMRTKMLGIKYTVDHTVPLIHPLVCGLHVEHNLRVIPASENYSKSNHYWPDMP